MRLWKMQVTGQVGERKSAVASLNREKPKEEDTFYQCYGTGKNRDMYIHAKYSFFGIKVFPELLPCYFLVSINNNKVFWNFLYFSKTRKQLILSII